MNDDISLVPKKKKKNHASLLVPTSENNDNDVSAASCGDHIYVNRHVDSWVIQWTKDINEEGSVFLDT